MTIAYPLDHLRREAAFLAYHLHWGLGEILALTHGDRVSWVGEVSRINTEIMASLERDRS